MQGLAAYERGICDCGFHEGLIADDSLDFTLGVKTCPNCALRERYQRVLHEADERRRAEKWGKNPPPDRDDPADGRKVFPKVRTAAEAALEKAAAKKPRRRRR